MQNFVQVLKRGNFALYATPYISKRFIIEINFY
jgi:hypothetical protein